MEIIPVICTHSIRVPKAGADSSGLEGAAGKGAIKWHIHVCGLPLPYGFATQGLTCDKDVFTITSASGHQAISGTFYVMQEALTMIEMLYCSRGVTEEETNQCYYAFLPEDHQKYMERIGKL